MKMFKNPILEILSLSGPKMMISFHLIIATTTIVYGSFNFNLSLIKAISIFISGFASWTFFEYLLHRYLFHLEGRSKIIKAFHFAMHGYHHTNPNDSNRLFMPPVPALLFLLVFFGLFFSIIGKNTFYFLPGFEMGYLSYSLVHYLIHTNSPRKYIQKMKLHHNLHHFKFENKAFGVSSYPPDQPHLAFCQKPIELRA